ncbi:MAG: hypothetical protein ACI4ES_12185 [Roseburia sp.]
MDFFPVTVPVIANFSTFGEIRPLYVRINGVSLKVMQCTPHMEMMNPTFDCVVDDSGIAKPVRLSYSRNNNTWTVVNC